MKLYQIFTRPVFLYKFLLEFSCRNNDQKIVLQKVIYFLNKTDKFILIIPVVFMTERCLFILTHDKPFLTQPLSKIEKIVVDLSSGFTSLVNFPIVLKGLNSIYLNDPFIYWFFSIFLFYASRVLCNSYKAYRNEAFVSECFHSVNHCYRDFIDSIIKIKKHKNIFRNTLLDNHSQLLGKEYNAQIERLCRRAQRSMAKIINDEHCYISIKWLEDEENGKYKLKHDRSYPDDPPLKHLTGITIENKIVIPPPTLFQKIINLKILITMTNSQLKRLGIWGKYAMM